MPVRVFISLAEVSGDQHAAPLVRSLLQLDPQIIVEGHGGPRMRSAGGIIHTETARGAAMGLHGATRALQVWKMLRWTRQYFTEHRPDVHVGVDSPDMNFHFARLAHEMGIPVVQYVAPQLWAWREGRIAKVRRWIDRLACILPFEEEWFRQRGVNATFVGHPLFDELRPADPARDVGPRFPDRPPVIGLLAGSRRSEARANFPVLLEVADRIRREFPQATFLAPTTAATDPIVADLAKGRPGFEQRQDAFDELVPRCDLCLTVSGTATLHVAIHNVPMITLYRMNSMVVRGLSWLMKTDTFALVNLLAQNRRHIVPEFIPLTGPSRPVADRAIAMLKNPAELSEQRRDLAALVQSLDRPGASMNVAKLVLETARSK